MNELNHTAGKGDKERSPAWRRNYNAINFHRGAAEDGFARRGNRLVKAYGGKVARFVFPENEGGMCLAENFLSGYICTLPKGHRGLHIAQTKDGRQQVARWINTSWLDSALPHIAANEASFSCLVVADISRGDPGFLAHAKTPEEACGKRCDGWVCTRKAKHSGDHAAHSGAGSQCATWPQVTPQVPGLLDTMLFPGDPGYLPAGIPSDCPSMREGLSCTLTRGHAGDHVAHSTSDRMVARWPQTVEDLSRYMLANNIKL